MRISKFTIDGYKSLVNFTMNDLSTNNMLYGYNNSGKSNAIRILELIFKSKENLSNVQAGALQLSNNTSNFWSGVLEDCAFIFNNAKAKKEIAFSVNLFLGKDEIKSALGSWYNDFNTTYLSGNSHDEIAVIIGGVISQTSFTTANFNVTSTTINRRNFLVTDETGNPNYLTYLDTNFTQSPLLQQKYSIVETVLSLFNNCVLFLDNDRYFINESEEVVAFDTLEARNFKKWIFQCYVNPELYPTFQELIKFIKEFKVTAGANVKLKDSEAFSPINNFKIEFAKSSNDLQIMLSSGSKRLPINNFGTGIQQVLFILAKIFSSKAKIILIEELELNLSPRYQLELLKHINKLIENKKINQLFFTTHSKYFVYRGDFRIYEINLNNEGNSTCTRVASPRKLFFNLESIV